MKTLKCEDLGGVTCPFVAKGETAEEVKMKMMEHALGVHADTMKNMSEEEKKLVEKEMDEKMKDE